jgi:hypothetical protein
MKTYHGKRQTGTTDSALIRSYDDGASARTMRALF